MSETRKAGMMTKEKAKKQSDIIKELRDAVKLRGEKIARYDARCAELQRERNEAHIRADAAEAKYKKADEVWSSSVQVLETIVHRLQRVIESIIKDISDPTRVARIERHKFEG